MQEFWRQKTSSISSSSTRHGKGLIRICSKSDDAHKLESAALLIQYTVRRWLAKRWMLDKGSVFVSSKPSARLRLQPQLLTEERAMDLQHKIETWQHRNKVNCVSNVRHKPHWLKF